MARASTLDRAIKVTENDFSESTMTNAGVCMMQKPDHALAESYFRQGARAQAELRRSAAAIERAEVLDRGLPGSQGVSAALPER